MSDELHKTSRMVAANSVSASAVGRASLLVSGPAGTYKMPLPDGGELTIGRAPESTLCIDDPLLSRHHALLRVTGDALTVIDLGSSNGTRVGQCPLDPHAPFGISIGDVVTVGATVLVVQAAWSGQRPRHVWSHGYFEARIEDECARAENGGRPFAVVRLRFAAGSEGRIEDALVSLVRAMDVLATYAPGEYEVLLLEVDAARAEEQLRRLGGALEADGLAVETGLALYPRDGRAPESLIARAAPGAKRSSSRHAPGELHDGGALRRLEPLLRRVAAGTLPVLLLGETGVGKDVFARRIHALSPRAHKPFVSINCAAISESLLESELFGHEKGAFTGAFQAKAGLLESAEGGAVFLDEIGEMPLAIQAKLLRVLEQREVVRVGALRPRAIDVLFLAATNRDLETEVAREAFRRDLYFRLAGFSLVVPPLRDRVDEIEPLARHFAAAASARSGIRPPEIAADAIAVLEGYGWPGNIRELRNVIERAVLLASGGGAISAAHLPVDKMGTTRAHAALTAAAHAPPLPPPSAPAPPTRRQPAVNPEATLTELPDDDRERIVAALRECGGNQTTAARVLGISRRTLVSRLSEYGLPRPRRRDDE